MTNVISNLIKFENLIPKNDGVGGAWRFKAALDTKVTPQYIYFDLGGTVNRYDRKSFEQTKGRGSWADYLTLEYS